MTTYMRFYDDDPYASSNNGPKDISSWDLIGTTDNILRDEAAKKDFEDFLEGIYGEDINLYYFPEDFIPEISIPENIEDGSDTSTTNNEEVANNLEIAAESDSKVNILNNNRTPDKTDLLIS